jgi:HEAT repeat protein
LCDLGGVRPAVSLLLVALVAVVACDRSGDGGGGYVVQTDLAPAIKLLGAEEQADADEAVERLAGNGDAAVPALEAAVAHESHAIALGAIEALGQIGTPRADAALIAIAKGQTDEELRATALLKLGEGGRPDARPVLEAALSEKSDMVRRTAAYACGGLCTSLPAIDRLVELGLGDIPDAELGRLRITLTQLLASPEQSAAIHVREAIQHQTFKILREDGPLDLRARAALIAGDAGSNDVEPVLVTVARDSKSVMLRLAAIQWLGKHGTAAAVPVVTEALQDRTTAATAALALRALAAQGVVEAGEAIRQMPGQPTQRPSGG